jgi:hypothetical protein
MYLTIYLTTEHRVYHNKVSGDDIQSKHPVAFKLPDGRTIDVSHDVRIEALERKSYERLNNDVYASINKDIKFKIIALWERDPTTSGERIRWIVPKGSDAIYE